MSAATEIMTAQATKPISILLIEDDFGDACLLEAGLAKLSGRAPEVRHENTMEAGLNAAEEDRADVILLDLNLPDGQGISNLERVLERCPSATVVILSGQADEELAIEALQLGAQDYFVKGEFTPRFMLKSLTHAMQRSGLQQELEESRRREMEVKDEFLSHVSHELRTPLTAIMQFGTILRDGIAGEISDQQAEYLDIIRRNGESLKTMIGTLMDVTRASSGKLTHHPACVDVSGLVRRVVDSQAVAASESKVEINPSIAGALPFAVADPARVNQVLTNLVSNALKFTSANGRIDVRVAVGAEGALQITVADSGCGIPAGQVEKIFDRLYQVGSQNDASRRGLGLGLHICSEIVAMHGGKIWAESVEGEGSQLHFTLPAYDLSNFVRQVAVVDAEPQPEISLVAVQVRAAHAGARAKGLEDATSEASAALTECMLGISDMVLPQHPSAGGSPWVFGLARAGAEGGAAIANRVKFAWDRNQRMNKAGFKVEVRNECFAMNDPGSVESAVKNVTSQIARCVDTLNR